VQGEPAASGNGEPAERKGTDAMSRLLSTSSKRFPMRLPAAFRTSRFSPASLKNDASLQNYNRNTQEKFAHISMVQGKTHSGPGNCTPAILARLPS
jgi:hypothetical protein